ncbi:MAG: hypothetical protein EA376_01715 [Phycisphaeraceae bacterium]|nr:MAG: hypothetical protein EA376_01715 [Phycisphaeraceae bacterium]
MSSEIIQLRAKDDSEPRHVIWLRTLRKTGQIVYVGHYGLCDTPEGVRCCKVVFPLPCGNATVILEPVVHEDGSLELRSCGERFGDPGFYFLLRDRKGRHWTRYIRSMRESIRVYEDEDGDLRTDHVLTLWRRRVFTLHYRIRPAAERVERQGERQTPHPGTRSGLQSTA